MSDLEMNKDIRPASKAYLEGMAAVMTHKDFNPACPYDEIKDAKEFIDWHQGKSDGVNRLSKSI